MKGSSLLVGFLALGFLLVALWWTRMDTAAPESALQPGDRLVEFDINDAADILIQRQATEWQITRSEDHWVVPAVHDYPANFERLVTALRQVAQLRVGQVVRGGEDWLDEFGLHPDAEATGDQPTMILVFRDAAGETLGQLSVGRNRTRTINGEVMPVPDGVYMRMNDGPVVLVAEPLQGLPTDRSSLLDKTLLRINEDALARMHKVRRDGSTLTVTRTEDGQFDTPDKLAAHEAVSRSGARQWFQALRFFSFHDVAGRRDEAIEDAFGEAVDVIEAETVTGEVIRLMIGETAEGGLHYFRIEIEGEGAEQLLAARRYAGWTFTMPANIKAQLLLSRDRLIEERSVQPDEEETPNGVPTSE